MRRLDRALAAAMMAALLPAATHSGAPPIPSDRVVPASTSPTSTRTALTSPSAARVSRRERRANILAHAAGPIPPWINKHGYLLRSIRRSVARGGCRA